MRHESSVSCAARSPLRVLNFVGTTLSFEHLGSEIIYPDGGDLVLHPSRGRLHSCLQVEKVLVGIG